MTVRAAAVILVLAAACGATPPHVGATGDDAVVYVRSQLGDAGLWVDDIYIGSLDGLKSGVALSPGAHRFEVRRDDYYSRYFEVALKARDRVHLDATMAAILP